MYYIIGDIHGHFDKLTRLFDKIKKHITIDDSIIFLGDYIDRGPRSYDVIEFLIDIKKKYRIICLKGNHEELFLNYLNGKDASAFLYNGGRATVHSYEEAIGKMSLPEDHKIFFNSLQLYYETTDFIAVHAGLRPGRPFAKQSEKDMLWIREEFYLQHYSWHKLIVFGHTASTTITGIPYEIYDDPVKNIICIDTGAAYGGRLTCLRLPDKMIFQSY